MAHHRKPSVRRERTLSVSLALGAVFAAATTTAGALPGDSRDVEEIADPAGTPPTEPVPAADPVDTAGLLPPAPAQILPVVASGPGAELLDSLRRATVRDAERAAAEAEAMRPRTFFPVSGTVTSGFGPRWGTTHYGLDIANRIGTPIVSVTDGTVIDAGPAAGFGLWVRIQQDDGTIGVFGHIDEALVSVGQRVSAGETIATVGNRGQSTGPHLHYEVWQSDGTKTAPMAWLNARGIGLPSDAV